LVPTCRRISRTWPARFLSTWSRHTTRHGQSLLGQFSSRANCFRRSLANALSLTSSASNSVASRGLPFFIMNLKYYSNASWHICHLERCGFLSQGALAAVRALLPRRNHHLAGGFQGQARAAKCGGLRPSHFLDQPLNRISLPVSDDSGSSMGFHVVAAQSSLTAPFFLPLNVVVFAFLTWQRSCSLNSENMKTIKVLPGDAGPPRLARRWGHLGGFSRVAT